jgi:NAD(P)-dependent dehydrogenase (short-subunit alcohol dehydrogenase family)
MSDPHLPGRPAIVTGAGRGFGRAIAAALVADGTRVVGVARDRDALDQLHQELGAAFTPLVADVRDPGLADRVLAEHRPHLLVLNAGATPHAATLAEHTWETFSTNWHTDVQHVFHFVRAALRLPLDPGSTVISLSSGAARQGSPLSGGYAGAKATVSFISAYAGSESARAGLGVRFTALLPKLTPATSLGSTFVDAYAGYEHLTREAYLEGFGPVLSPEHVAEAVLRLAAGAVTDAPAHLLTADHMTELA